MSFTRENETTGELVGTATGAVRLVVLIQPVGADEEAGLHRHEADQILRVRRGEVLIQVGDEVRVCGPGELAVAPAGVAHGFAGTGAPALFEVLGERACGTWFDQAGGEPVEVHRGDLPWDRPASRPEEATTEAGWAAVTERWIVPEHPDPGS